VRANRFVPGGPTLSIWKEGATRAQRRADYADCKLEAIREVPTAVGVGSTPGFSSPGSVLCTGHDIVTCNTVGGYNNPGSVYSYDASARTRQQYVLACLIKKGYVRKQTTFCQDPNDMTTEDCVVPTGL
jgi:hypothetical protein